MLGADDYHGRAELCATEHRGRAKLFADEHHGRAELDAELDADEYHGRTELGADEYHSRGELGTDVHDGRAELCANEHHGRADFGTDEYHSGAELCANDRSSLAFLLNRPDQSIVDDGPTLQPLHRAAYTGNAAVMRALADGVPGAEECTGRLLQWVGLDTADRVRQLEKLMSGGFSQAEADLEEALEALGNKNAELARRNAFQLRDDEWAVVSQELAAHLRRTANTYLTEHAKQPTVSVQDQVVRDASYTHEQFTANLREAGAGFLLDHCGHLLSHLGSADDRHAQRLACTVASIIEAEALSMNMPWEWQMASALQMYLYCMTGSRQAMDAAARCLPGPVTAATLYARMATSAAAFRGLVRKLPKRVSLLFQYDNVGLYGCKTARAAAMHNRAGLHTVCNMEVFALYANDGAPFSNADVGKPVQITGDDVLVDGVPHMVNWGSAKHFDVRGTIKSVEEEFKGKVTLEHGPEFENGDGGVHTQARGVQASFTCRVGTSHSLRCRTT